MGERSIKLAKVLLLGSSLASLVILAAAAYRENFHGSWREVQAEYKDLLIATANNDLAKASAEQFPIKPKQIYLPELEAVDRCTTCHLGVENPAMAGMAQPLARHSGDLLKSHPPDKFGCTVCHGGQGAATAEAAAHGWLDSGGPMPHVDSPLLRDAAVYTNCGKCHAEIDLYGADADLFAGASGASLRAINETSLRQGLPGAEHLSKGKQLTTKLGCLGCHLYRGRGGTLGPDLTYVGDKTKHDFDFSRVRGEHTVEQWLFEHFKLPQQVSLNTVMPDMGLTDAQARDLSLYMMSLHRKSAPASHMPPPQTVYSSGEAVRGETLFQMFCSACHGADGYGTTMRAGLWPSQGDPWGRDWDAVGVVTQRRGDVQVLVPSLHHADTLGTVSDDYLRQIIANGRPGTKMPAWGSEGGLSNDEIELLVAFIRRWDEPEPDLAAVASLPGNPQVGASLYRANCAACHGDGGAGGIGVSLNSPTFLAAASDAFLRDTIVYGRPNTAMPAWREFDAREISDLVAHLRSWQPKRSDVDRTVAMAADSEAAGVSVEIGATLYQANCVMCHGDNGAGDLGPSLSTQAFLTVVPDSFLAETLVSGRPGTGMPSWRHVNDEDLASLIRYLRTWQTEPSKSEQWREQVVPRGDWDAGRFLFAGNCASCHGPHGEGATGPQLNNPVFLRTVTNAMLKEWISHGKEGTEMRPFIKGAQGVTELSDRQIEDIIAYLRLLERAGETEIRRVAKSPHGRPQNGAQLYATSCSACHGERGEGASGPALSNPGFLRFASDGFLMATMALGRHGTEMRPVKKGPQSILELSSDEVNDLVAHLRSWEQDPPFGHEGEAPIPHRFVVPWDLARGRSLFASHCAGCHGQEGKGSWAPELNNEGFLAAATDGLLQATIVRGRKGTAMRPFGRGANGLSDLNDRDIDDIVAYMRQWSKSVPSPMTIPAEKSLQLGPIETEAPTASSNQETNNHNRKAAPVAALPLHHRGEDQ